MIAAYRGISIPSRVIRARTWGPYSHLSWIARDGSEFEAWVGGTRWMSRAYEQHTPGTHVDLFDLDLTPGEQDGLVEFFTSELGLGYDWLGILHFATRLPEYGVGRRTRFCSEWVALGFERIRRPLLLRVPAYRVDPSTLTYSPLLRAAGSLVVPGRAKRPQEGPTPGPAVTTRENGQRPIAAPMPRIVGKNFAVTGTLETVPHEGWGLLPSIDPNNPDQERSCP